MSDSTNIMDLPMDSIGTNIPITTNSNSSTLSNQSNSYNPDYTPNINNSNNPNNSTNSNNHLQSTNGGVTLDQNTISQIVSGLQQATISGATQLPSRDIPMNTTGHNLDPYMQPNYVPTITQNNNQNQTDDNDYIKQYDDTSDITNKYNRNSHHNSLDETYNEIQTPLLLAILYFLFQLPFFRKFLYGYFPILYSNDGNLNINGFLFTSTLFGIIFYLLNKITNHFGTF
jgi:hypothetical protein